MPLPANLQVFFLFSFYLTLSFLMLVTSVSKYDEPPLIFYQILEEEKGILT